MHDLRGIFMKTRANQKWLICNELCASATVAKKTLQRSWQSRLWQLRRYKTNKRKLNSKINSRPRSYRSVLKLLKNFIQRQFLVYASNIDHNCPMGAKITSINDDLCPILFFFVDFHIFWNCNSSLRIVSRVKQSQQLEHEMGNE